MYSSVGICELPHKVKKRLCDSIPSQFGWEDDTLSWDDTDHRCSKHSTQLRVREIEHLKRKVMMWHCPEPRRQLAYFDYYIAKSQFKNTIIAFRSASVANTRDIYTDAALYILN